MTDLVICLLLAVSVFLVFGQTARHEFINLDDDEYIYENRDVRAGITLHGLRTAFTRPHGVNWHPLTTLSHMLDCQLYRLWAGGHHLGNVVLHALTAVLLYLVLERMTGRTACSAFAAFFFALHPLRVESVAWVSERKDVLSGLFFMLTLAAYVAQVRKPASIARSLLLPSVFALGLMCKPMLVTVPLILLLLDYWPLQRMSTAETGFRATPSLFALLLEKSPLAILSAGSCIITLFVQTSALASWQTYGIGRRIGNSLVAYVEYLGMLVWPSGLAPYYPYSTGAVSLGKTTVAAALFLGLSWACWHWRRRQPYLIVGWLWYVVMLVPVIGLVQVGSQCMADRYTYLPLIGPVVAITWLVADLAGPSVNRRCVFSVAGSVALLAITVGAVRQTAYWRNDVSLWTRTVNCTTNNYIARLHLGLAWSTQGRNQEAAKQYEEALRIFPGFPEAHLNLGCALNLLGKTEAAQRQYEEALKARPAYASARNNLGMILLDRGEVAAAGEQFQKALAIDPNYALAQNNLGIVLMASRQYAAAAERFRRAIALDANLPLPHANLGFALGQIGQSAEAAAELRAFLRAQSDNPTALAWLAWVLATAEDDSVRNGPQAVELARKAAALSRAADPRILDALAAALAETGQFAAAAETAQAALDLANKAAGQSDLAGEIQKRIELYRRSRPFRQSPMRALNVSTKA